MSASVAELTGVALDWAAATAYGYKPEWLRQQVEIALPKRRSIPRFSSDWSQGGLIIEREKIEIYPHAALDGWSARHGPHLRYGERPLEAAMRAFVTSRLGDLVRVPAALLPGRVERTA